ncbi:MAG: BamA/TamA family outer membrane protein [bacterium]
MPNTKSLRLCRILAASALILLFLKFLLFADMVCAEKQERKNFVRQLRIVGAKKISKKTIKQNLPYLQPPSLWKFWKAPPEFTESKLQEGIKNVQALYQKNGFYAANIDTKVLKKENAVTIIFTIYEGRPIMIKHIVFAIKNGKAQEWEPLFRGIIPLEEGTIFKVAQYEDAKTKILEHLANSGYPRARLSGNVFIYETEYEADVHFSVDLGPFTRFGTLHIYGNDKVPLKIISEEIAFIEGETFSMAQVVQSQTQIYRLNLFRSVLLEPEKLHDGKGPVNINLYVQERKPYTVETGIGYGSEDNIRVRFAGIYRNFLGGANELSLLFRLSSLIEHEALIFKHPYFIGPSSAFISSLSRQKETFASFESTTFTLENKINKKYKPHLSLFWAHLLDINKIYGLSETTQEELNYLQEKEYILSSFQTGGNYDTTDSPLNPTEGFIASIFFEPSFKVIGSEISYIKASAEFKHYYQILGGPILAYRLLAGTISPFGVNQKAIPLFKRFFAGGTYSVRGYGYQKLGPLDDSGEPIGGNSLIEGSAEVRVPLINKLWGVLFFDFGNVSLNSWQFEWEELRYASGGGLRYNTVIGPIRLDIGYILNPEDEEESRYQVHFSIGHAF